MTEPAYPGLPDQLAEARAAVKPEPMTIEECQRILETLRRGQIVEKVTMIRCLEFLIGNATAADCGQESR